MNSLNRILIILCGNAIIAFAIVAFLEPTGIITGGAAGIALAFQHWFGLPIFLTISVVNAAAFIAGWYVLGRTFALTTLLSSVVLPFFISLFGSIDTLSHLTDDILLCALLAGSAFGIGIGIVIRSGASTGGMDIPPLVAKKWFGIPVSSGMLFANGVVLAMQIPSANAEGILYGLVNITIMSLMLNRILLAGSQQAQVLIISSRYEAIRKRLLSEDSGVTMLHIETGLAETEQKAVLCVIPPRKLFMIKQIVQEIDANSFMMINTITEVRGKGFSSARD
ncbi:MAG: YitT family protein [Sporomusaceae bacterium]|nr:YitT family protein [Sporomusaceae bacterium]